MTNLEWLEKIKKEDEQYLELSVGDGNKEGWQVESQYRMKFRKMKALEIIAEELCLLRQHPTVVNNYNVSK